MDTNEILKKLEGVFETTNGWQARCPAHDDAKANLSIAEDGGKLLLHCHAGCATTDVVQAMGLEMRDLFSDKGEQAKVVARYNYDDADGQLLLQIVRDNHKNFRARRPDGNGGWVYSTAEVKLVPYRLPMILRSKRVLITEGEKDADTGVRKLRLPSTTNPFGAGKWREEFSAYFTGKSVALCPHNDDAGRKHMQSVACSLFPVAKKIKSLAL
jgi:putative DNA primase/helicase